MWADPWYPRTPSLAEVESDSAAPQVAGSTAPGLSPRSGWSLAFLGPSSLARGADSGPPANTLHSPRSSSLRVCVRVRVRAVSPPARALPGSCPAGAPFATGLCASLPRRVDVVLRVPPRGHSCGVGTGRVHIWTRGRVLLPAAVRPEKVCARLVGRFELLLVNSF